MELFSDTHLLFFVGLICLGLNLLSHISTYQTLRGFPFYERSVFYLFGGWLVDVLIVSVWQLLV